MILLFLLPFYDRGPERRPERRPIATITGIIVICAMAYLTYNGATPARPTRSKWRRPRPSRQGGQAAVAEWNEGREVVAQSGCVACHKIGDNGNVGPGPPT